MCLFVYTHYTYRSHGLSPFDSMCFVLIVAYTGYFVVIVS